jgi:hypothetical protein
MPFISSIAHVNLVVPEGTLHLADVFYGQTLGLTKINVPEAQKHILAWSVTPSPSSLHVEYFL